MSNRTESDMAYTIARAALGQKLADRPHASRVLSWSEAKRRCEARAAEQAIDRTVQAVCAEHFPDKPPPTFRFAVPDEPGGYVVSMPINVPGEPTVRKLDPKSWLGPPRSPTRWQRLWEWMRYRMRALMGR